MNQKEFEQLIEQTQYALVATLYKFTLNREAAQDIAQDAYVKIWEMRQQIKNEAGPQALLFKIAIHKAIDARRRKETHHETLPDQLSGPIFNSGENEQTSLLGSILNFTLGLKTKQRCTFILRDIEGYALQEIADILESNIGTVRVNLHLARKKIRAFLSARYPEYVEEFK